MHLEIFMDMFKPPNIYHALFRPFPAKYPLVPLAVREVLEICRRLGLSQHAIDLVEKSRFKQDMPKSGAQDGLDNSESGASTTTYEKIESGRDGDFGKGMICQYV